MFLRSTLLFILVLQLVIPQGFALADSEFDLSKIDTDTLDRVLSSYIESGRAEDKDLALAFLQERLQRSSSVNLKLLEDSFLKIITPKSTTNEEPGDLALSFYLKKDVKNLDRLVTKLELTLPDHYKVEDRSKWIEQRYKLITAKFLLCSLDENLITEYFISNKFTQAIKLFSTLAGKYIDLRDSIIPSNPEEREAYEIENENGTIERLRDKNVVNTLDFYVVLSSHIYSLLKQLQIILYSGPTKSGLVQEEINSALNLIEKRFDILQDVREFTSKRIHLGIGEPIGKWQNIQADRNNSLFRYSIDAWRLCLRDARESLDVVTRVMNPPECANISWPETYVQPKSTIVHDRFKDHFTENDNLEKLASYYFYWNDLSLIAVNRELHYFDGALRSGLLPPILEKYTSENIIEIIDKSFEKLLAYRRTLKSIPTLDKVVYQEAIFNRIESIIKSEGVEEAISLASEFINENDISIRDFLSKITEIFSQPASLLFPDNYKEQLSLYFANNGINKLVVDAAFARSEKIREETIDSIPQYLGMAFDELKPDAAILSDSIFRRELVQFFEENNQFRRTQFAIITDRYQSSTFVDDIGKYPYFRSVIGFKTDTYRIDQKWFSICQKLHPFLERNWSNAHSVGLGMSAGDIDASKPNHIKPIYKKLTNQEAFEREKEGLEVLRGSDDKGEYLYYRLSPWTYWNARTYEDAKDQWVESEFKEHQFWYHFHGNVIRFGSWIAAAIIVKSSLGTLAPLSKIILINAATLYMVDKTVDAFIHPEGSFQALPFEDKSAIGITKDVLSGMLLFASMIGVGVVSGELFGLLVKSKPTNLLQHFVFESGMLGSQVLGLTAFSAGHYFSTAVYNQVVRGERVSNLNLDETLREILLITIILRLPHIASKINIKSPIDSEKIKIFFDKHKGGNTGGDKVKLPPPFTIIGSIARTPNLISSIKRSWIDFWEKFPIIFPPSGTPVLQPALVGASRRVDVPQIKLQKPTISRATEAGPDSGAAAPEVAESSYQPRAVEESTEARIASSDTLAGDVGLDISQRRFPLHKLAAEESNEHYGRVGRWRKRLWNGSDPPPTDPVNALQFEVRNLQRWNGTERVPARTHHAKRLEHQKRMDSLEANLRGLPEPATFGLEDLLTNATQAKLLLKFVKDTVYGNRGDNNSLGHQHSKAVEANKKLEEIKRNRPDLLNKEVVEHDLFPTWKLTKGASKKVESAEQDLISEAKVAIETLNLANSNASAPYRIYNALYNYFLNLEPSVRVLRQIIPKLPQDSITTATAKEIIEDCGKFFKEVLPSDPELRLVSDIARLQADRTAELRYAQSGCDEVVRAASKPVAHIGGNLFSKLISSRPLLSKIVESLRSTIEVADDGVIAKSFASTVEAIEREFALRRPSPLSGETEGNTASRRAFAESKFTLIEKEFSSLRLLSIVQRIKAKLVEGLPIDKGEIALFFPESKPSAESIDKLRILIEYYDSYLECLGTKEGMVERVQLIKELEISNKEIVFMENGGPRMKFRKKFAVVATLSGMGVAGSIIFAIAKIYYPDLNYEDIEPFIPLGNPGDLSLTKKEKDEFIDVLQKRKTLFPGNSDEETAKRAEIDALINIFRSVPVTVDEGEKVEENTQDIVPPSKQE